MPRATRSLCVTGRCCSHADAAHGVLQSSVARYAAGRFTLKHLDMMRALHKHSIDYVLSDRAVRVCALSRRMQQSAYSCAAAPTVESSYGSSTHSSRRACVREHAARHDMRVNNDASLRQRCHCACNRRVRAAPQD